ncbi:2-polyprenyl-6-methoxyphenol hydroxylase [Pedobacter lusitanus]|uniref:Flavin-dependent monooxygenase n=1 Tax=Pedobacter lusitanus TaxID=1503925 RepID=A0A0D0GB93_9SPHI|nr:NAD(P)/FAD-dependent oxidoreductase [Pedobacter lusitanus]KIO74537.1 2-polyprenyl-6-methoxyphenol hydroxylase [Pedobacter lusitanus]
MNIITGKKIAIVGGGPGGLTLARLLQLNGAEVKVYERDSNKDARTKGATLDLHEESGLKAIREAGLIDQFHANFRPGAEKMRIMDKDARIVFEDKTESADHISRPEIDRGPLQDILLESLQPGTIVWDSHFVKLSPHNDSWEITFKNGNSAFADIVIAADGANSKIRPYITAIKPFYSGVTIVEGAVYNSETVVPRIHQALNGGKIFAMGSEKSLIISSKGDGSLVFYTGCKTAENWAETSEIDFSDKAQVLEWFKTAYADWDELWVELFENAAARFVPRPQYCMPFDQTWEAQPNLTMLGDAAHLMPPYAGEGVNMAMLDAVELSQCLLNAEFTDTKSAIAAYENQMRLRASATAKTTMDSTAALHSKEAISFLLDIVG